MRLAPTTLKAAKEFVAEHHRHNAPPTGWKWGVALYDEDEQIGVAMAGRPVARMADDGQTLEVTRVCTLGHRNANSMLYGAIIRAAKALGYTKLITYTLPEESGSSLKAVGFQYDGEAGGGEWSRKSRERKLSEEAGYSPSKKIRWRIDF